MYGQSTDMSSMQDPPLSSHFNSWTSLSLNLIYIIVKTDQPRGLVVRVYDY